MGKINRKALSLAGALILGVAFLGDAEARRGQDDFDRLDGHGRSGKKVDVIEWAGNLEIHVYPAGSLVGLALKLDKRNEKKPVMVIGYRFDNDPKNQLIRRAILGIPLGESFQVFRDPDVAEYDKIVITNHNLSANLAQFKLDPEPTQLYPDGHPSNTAVADASGAADPARIPASQAHRAEPAEGSEAESGPYYIIKEPAEGAVDEEGTIKPFSW